MSHNTFGHLFRVTTWGESHGAALGCVVDGCPPGIRFTRQDIQDELDRRRPGRSRFVTQRREPDQIKVLSGFLLDEGDGETMVTTGTPVAMMIENVDQRSKDYGEIARQYRPGHADYTYDVKYGLRDYRGGGRSSARETAARVAAGAIARRVVPGLTVRGALISIGEKAIDRSRWNWNFVDDPDNPFFTPDPLSVPVFAEYLDAIRKAGSSVGAVVEIVADGVPAGLGAPIYAKLDQDIASGLMSINAVKGVEIGNGFEAARITGEENADEMRMGNDGKPVFLSNHAGGILGGISTGQPVVARFAVKPTSSILSPRRSIDVDGFVVVVRT
jgi:chorismate synthase